jgi:membrane-bound serine protease (ClpP class)
MELIAALLVVGVLLLIAEIFLPGLIAGIMGFCSLVAAIVIAYAQFGLKTGNGVLLGVLILLVVGTMLWLRFFPNSPLARPFISRRTIRGTAEFPELLEKTGTAHTTLRPAGTAIIEGRRIDVVTEGPLVAKGAFVKVVQVEGARVVVRAV